MYEDKLTHAQAVENIDRAYLNDKKAFSVIFDTGTLTGGSTYKAALTTPGKATGKRVHLKPSFFSTSANEMTLALYEDATFTNGTVARILNHFREENPAVASSVVKTNVTATLAGVNLMASTAGGNFANQPAGKKMTVVSDSADDDTQTVTIYGTKTGATDTVTSETVSLDGTTDVDTTLTTWQTILGVELSASCAGTVTIKNSGGTVITISTGNLSAGVAAITESRARDSVLRHDASGASTKVIGVIGTSPEGAVISAVDALNGATEEDHGTTVFRTVTKILIGDVASATNCWILRPEILLSQVSAGAGEEVQMRSVSGIEDEFILEPGTDYVFCVTNGATDDSIGYVNLFFLEI